MPRSTLYPGQYKFRVNIIEAKDKQREYSRQRQAKSRKNKREQQQHSIALTEQIMIHLASERWSL
jgi:hypothetical protein